MTPFSEAFSNKGVLEIVAPCLFKKSIVLSSPPKEKLQQSEITAKSYQGKHITHSYH